MKYTLTNRSEKDIPVSRLTATAPPYNHGITPMRSAAVNPARILVPKEPALEKRDLIATLSAARKTRIHEALGWLRDMDAAREGRALAVQERRDRTLQYWSELKSYVQGQAAAKGITTTEFLRYDGRCRDGNFGKRNVAASQENIPKGELSKRYLCWAMGNKSTSSLKKWIKNKGVDGRSVPICNTRPRRGQAGLSVIDDFKWAEVIFTSKRMYLDHEMAAFVESSDDFLTEADITAERKRKEVEWNTVVSKDETKMAEWECRSHNHLVKQPEIRGALVTQLLANSCTSFEGLAAAINNWCSPATIKKWFHSFDTFGIYRKEIKPGLTAGMSLHFSFLPFFL